jgi:hypothetical protein
VYTPPPVEVSDGVVFLSVCFGPMSLVWLLVSEPVALLWYCGDSAIGEAPPMHHGLRWLNLGSATRIRSLTSYATP